MNILRLRKIDKLYFGHEEIARLLNISPASAKVLATRYVKAGLLIRIKRNLYVLSEKWYALSQELKFVLANLIQVPSYVSLMTALSFYEISTQIQQNYIESIAIKRSKEIEIEDTIFRYTKIKPQLYFGFQKKENFFIAEPEKAFVDAIYLHSLGRYSLDFSSIDFERLDQNKISTFIEVFPEKTKKLFESYEYI